MVVGELVGWCRWLGGVGVREEMGGWRGGVRVDWEE